MRIDNLDDLYEWIKKNPPRDVEHLQQLLDQTMAAQNEKGLAAFCGISPDQMGHLLYDPLGASSPFGFRDFSPEILDGCPIFRAVEAILQMTVMAKSPFKMTAATGSLPVKVVKAVYEASGFKDDLVESGFYKLYKEADVNLIHAARLVLEMTPVVRKQHGNWLLTKKGEKLVLPENRAALFREFFGAFALKFNWAYFDLIGHPNAGQFGFAWLLGTVGHFGGTERLSSFYGKKYLVAFPALVESAVPSSWGTPERSVMSGVDIRFFLRFCEWFGLAAVEEKKPYTVGVDRYLVQKTELLDAVFRLPAMTG